MAVYALPLAIVFLATWALMAGPVEKWWPYTIERPFQVAGHDFMQTFDADVIPLPGSLACKENSTISGRAFGAEGCVAHV